MQDEDTERGVWAVVSAPGFGLLVGEIHFVHRSMALAETLTDALWHSQPVLIKPCYRLIQLSLPHRGPEGSTGTQFIQQCAPMANSLGASRLVTVIQGVLLFDEMEKGDLQRHKCLVEELESALMAARAERANIKLPGDIPVGPRRP